MASIEFRNLTKQFGKLDILRGFSFDIADKELVVLVGPSGCGKSTLLRMIAGLESVTGGEIVLDGQVINHVREKDRDIAMVFQNYALYPHMTVKQNLSFSLRMRKIAKDEQERRIMWAAQILELEEYLQRYPRQLSGGQRQRVAMGRALVREPKAFLLDEPLSNLDAKLRVQMRTEIRGLHQRLQTTMVYVTHDQVEAMTLADRVVVMRDGNIEQIGRPETLYDHPSNAFVAGFIGSPAINMLPGKLKRSEGKSWVELVDGTKVDCRAQSGEAGEDVLFGIRPEHLELTSSSEGLQYTVDVVEMLGREIEVYGHLQDGTRICAVLQDRRSLKPGDTVGLKLDSDKAHVFSAKSEQNLNAIQS